MFPDQVKNIKWFLIFTLDFFSKKKKKVQSQPSELLLASGTSCFSFILSLLSPKCLNYIPSSLSVKMFALFIHLPQQKSHQNFMKDLKALSPPLTCNAFPDALVF